MSYSLEVALSPEEAYRVLLARLASRGSSLLIAREPELIVVKRCLLLSEEEEDVPGWLKATVRAEIECWRGGSLVSISISRSLAERILPAAGLLASAFIIASWCLNWLSYALALEAGILAFLSILLALASENAKRDCLRELREALEEGAQPSEGSWPSRK